MSKLLLVFLLAFISFAFTQVADLSSSNSLPTSTVPTGTNGISTGTGIPTSNTLTGTIPTGGAAGGTDSTDGNTGSDAVSIVAPPPTTAPPLCVNSDTGVALCANVGFPSSVGIAQNKCTGLSDLLINGCVCRVIIDSTHASEGVRRCNASGGFYDDPNFPILIVTLVNVTTLPVDPTTGAKLFPPTATVDAPIAVDQSGNFTVAPGTCNACTVSSRNGAVTTFSSSCNLRNCANVSSSVSTVDASSSVVVGPSAVLSVSNTAVDGALTVSGSISGAPDLSVSVSVSSTGSLILPNPGASVVDLNVDFSSGSTATVSSANFTGSVVTFRNGSVGSFAGDTSGSGTTVQLESTSSINVGSGSSSTFSCSIVHTTVGTYPIVKAVATNTVFTQPCTGVTIDGSGTSSTAFTGPSASTNDIKIQNTQAVVISNGANVNAAIDSTNPSVEIVGSSSSPTSFSGSVSGSTILKVNGDGSATSTAVISSSCTPSSFDIDGGSTGVSVNVASVTTPTLSASGVATLSSSTGASAITADNVNVSGTLYCDSTVSIVTSGTTTVNPSGTLSVVNAKFGPTTSVSGSLQVSGTVSSTSSGSEISVGGTFNIGGSSSRPNISNIDFHFTGGSVSTLQSPVLSGNVVLTVDPDATVNVNGDVDGDSSKFVLGSGAVVNVGSVSPAKRDATPTVNIAPSVEGSAGSQVSATGVNLNLKGSVSSTTVSAPNANVTFNAPTSNINVSCSDVSYSGSGNHDGVVNAGTVNLNPSVDSTLTVAVSTNSSVSNVVVSGSSSGRSVVILSNPTNVNTVTITGGSDDSSVTQVNAAPVTADSATVSGFADVGPAVNGTSTQNIFRVLTIAANSDLVVNQGVILLVRPPSDGKAASATIDSHCRVSGDGSLHFSVDVTANEGAQIEVTTTVQNGTIDVGNNVTFKDLVLDHATIMGAGGVFPARISVGTLNCSTEGNVLVAVFNSNDTSNQASVGVADKCIITVAPTIEVKGDLPTVGGNPKIVLTCNDISGVDVNAIASANVELLGSKRAQCDGQSKVDGNNVVVYCASSSSSSSSDNSFASGIFVAVMSLLVVLF